MPLDFTQIGSGPGHRTIEPRDIYNRSNRPWSHLRHEQGEVLERWYDRRSERDLVVRQNTGGGKTAVGLLIAQSSLNELRLPVVYLAGNTYLVKQARAEADRLGFAITEDARSSDFLNGDAILVGTWQKLINGLSQFGVAGGDRDSVELGCVVVDDAHAALTAVEAQFRLELDQDHPAYEAILKVFADDLKAQSLTRWRELSDGDPGVTMRVPYWAWRRSIDSVVTAIHPHRAKDPVKWAWPLISEHLTLCEATFTAKSLEIRPLAPPIGRIPSFADAQRRVYLTATLADDSVLVTALDADAKTIARPVAPGRAADLGDRLILAPAELNPQFADIAVRNLVAEVAVKHNVVVLVPSDKAAGQWAPYGATVTPVSALEVTVQRLKGDEHLGLVVLANKYDGIDLPDDACRLLVIDGLPRALSPSERREASVLRRSPVLAARQIQRIEQGMGRGVRDTKDYCAVILLGDDLTALVSLRANRELFSPATAAQLALSREVAGQIAGEGLSAVREALEACLNRDPSWVQAARDALAETTYAERQDPSPTAVAQRDAFNLASTGQFGAAEQLLAVAANHAASAGDNALAGLLYEQQAPYLNQVDRNAAQAVQQRALQHNPLLLRPQGGVTVRPTRAVAVQADAASQYLTATYDDGLMLVLGLRELLDRLTWDPERTDDAEAAMKELGLHLGFASNRPDAEFGQGPDNLWLATARSAVIELKTGTKADTICKDDVDQLGGSLRWHQNAIDGSVTPTPVLMHRSSEHDTNATPPDGTRVITEAHLDSLKAAVREWATALAGGIGRWQDPAQVAEQLKAHKLEAGTFFTTYASAIRKTMRPGA